MAFTTDAREDTAADATAIVAALTAASTAAETLTDIKGHRYTDEAPTDGASATKTKQDGRPTTTILPKISPKEDMAVTAVKGVEENT